MYILGKLMYVSEKFQAKEWKNQSKIACLLAEEWVKNLPGNSKPYSAK